MKRKTLIFVLTLFSCWAVFYYGSAAPSFEDPGWDVCASVTHCPRSINPYNQNTTYYNGGYNPNTYQYECCYEPENDSLWEGRIKSQNPD